MRPCKASEGSVPGTLTDDNAAGADSDKQDVRVISWKFLSYFILVLVSIEKIMSVDWWPDPTIYFHSSPGYNIS
jgi:hypothetical protein